MRPMRSHHRAIDATANAGVGRFANVDPAFVSPDVEYPVGDGFSDLGIGEVMNPDAHRLAFGLPFPARVGVVAELLLLLRVDADHRWPLTALAWSLM